MTPKQAARIATLRQARLEFLRATRTAASNIKVTAIKSKHGPTYKFKVEGQVRKVKIKGTSTQVLVGTDKINGTLAMRILERKIHNADGSGKEITWATMNQIEKAVLAKMKEVEASLA